ncbi:MAG: restriction endonuclease subunit M [Coprococcus sp.]|nr:restriction endonuclease subunit M [Coprococcus sp.]
MTELNKSVLRILLKDRTTRRNIIWATEDYVEYGDAYQADRPITASLITGANASIVQPRSTKGKSRRTNRTKMKAEVSTPSWICNQQNNLVDAAWFKREDVFNMSQDNGWVTKEEPIVFGEERGRRWVDYVDARRLEIACGEAPYLTSRYDVQTGEPIKVKDRIGFFDRKLRVVNENASNEEEWMKWAYRSLESVYGFEFQGDSLLLGRKNLLDTFVENMEYRFEREPSQEELRRAARIISWNIWQMDGLTFTVPFGEAGKESCKIHDWRSKVTFLYSSLLKKS